MRLIMAPSPDHNISHRLELVHASQGMNEAKDHPTPPIASDMTNEPLVVVVD
jgi:hypothetical protein